MRTCSHFKNMVFQRDLPSFMTRLHGGFAGSFQMTTGSVGSCYVIEEEQPNENVVDTNGNKSESSSPASHSRAGVAQGIRLLDANVENHNENDISNANCKSAASFNLNNSVNEVNLASLLMPLPRNSSFRQCFLSGETNKQTDLMSRQVSNKTFEDVAQKHVTTLDIDIPELKSGNLILIIPDKKTARFTNPKSTFPSLSYSSFPRRCPVIVKIYNRGYEKYAIISSTRRCQMLPPFCLKLKHSLVTQSTSSPSCFTVVVDSSEGKTFTFEASNPDMASQWIQAFSTTNSAPYQGNPVQSLSQTIQQNQYLAKNSKSSHLPLMPILSESVEDEEE